MKSLISALLVLAAVASHAQHSPTKSILESFDLDLNESTQLLIPGKPTPVTITLLTVNERREPVLDMIDKAMVTIRVDDETVTLEAGNYNLPVAVGSIQIDCPVTAGYNEDPADRWGLRKAARIRAWPEGSPWIQPETFGYPVDQRWFAAMTWYSNEAVSVLNGKKYYHSGMDIGATESSANVLSATDGTVVASGMDTLLGADLPTKPRYDVILIRDFRGWVHRYSHVQGISGEVKPGAEVTLGQPIAKVGKEGHSGGWSHLHFEVWARQASDLWGSQDSYAFLWQSYLKRHRPKAIAVARPHRKAFAGQPVALDASKSWVAHPPIKYEWILSDGTRSFDPSPTITYLKPGNHSEILKITGTDGSIDYDFATSRIADPTTGQRPRSLDINFYPSLDLRPGQPITFTARGRGPEPSEDIWNFGDGSPPITVTSNLSPNQRAPDGYARLTHAYDSPGDYIVTVTTDDDSGAIVATQHLHIPIK